MSNYFESPFLGIPLDYSTDIAYLGFNQGSTIGESKSAYADVTWAVTDRLRLTAGARYSDESKEREGFNFIAGLDTNGVAMRTVRRRRDAVVHRLRAALGDYLAETA